MNATLPAVLFAVRRESMSFRRLCLPARHLRDAPCEAALAGAPQRPLLLLETGVGRDAVHAALDWLLHRRHPPSFIVYAGFAGALDAGCAVGDVLVANAVVDEAGRQWPTTWPAASLRRGRLLTMDRLITTALEKRRLGEQHQAQAVEMEAAHVAAVCGERGIPFGCVRAISDAVNAALSPQLVDLLGGSRVSPLRLATALVRRPRLLAELIRLERDTRRAAQRLGAALHTLLRRGTGETASS